MPDTSPVFWWWPGGDGTAPEELLLPRALADLFWEPVRHRRAGWTAAGQMHTASQGGRLRVTIVYGQWNNSGGEQYLDHKLESLSSHLERGGLVAFSSRKDKAWFAHMTTAPTRGNTLVLNTSNVFDSLWDATGGIAANDVVCIESANPENKREYNRLTSVSSSGYSVTLADAIREDYVESPVMVRWRDFFPCLRLPDDQVGRNFVSHDHRATFSLDITLEQDVAAMAALVVDGYPVSIDGPFDAFAGMEGVGGYSLDSAANRRTRRTAQDASVPRGFDAGTTKL